MVIYRKGRPPPSLEKEYCRPKMYPYVRCNNKPEPRPHIFCNLLTVNFFKGSINGSLVGSGHFYCCYCSIKCRYKRVPPLFVIFLKECYSLLTINILPNIFLLIVRYRVFFLVLALSLNISTVVVIDAY